MHISAPVTALFLSVALLVPPAASAEDGAKSLFPNEKDMQDLGRLAEGWLKQLTEQMQPMMQQLEALVDDLDAYEAPEIMPNGDIIIRRKQKLEEKASDQDDAVDL